MPRFQPSERIIRWGKVLLPLLGFAVFILLLAAFLWVSHERDSLKHRNAELKEDRATLTERRDILEAANAALVTQVLSLGEKPVVEPEDPETDFEIQEPEIQDPEIQNQERDDPERQDPEIQNPERGDDEVQNDENQDAENQDAEIQDEEIQDPEVDDPDPNSKFTFAVDDSCSPPEGEYVTDVSLSVQQTATTVTYILTCRSAPIIGPVQGG